MSLSWLAFTVLMYLHVLCTGSMARLGTLKKDAEHEEQVKRAVEIRQRCKEDIA